MIGHYLLTLTEAQEDRVLTAAFGPVLNCECPRCLVMTVLDTYAVDWCAWSLDEDLPVFSPGFRYEYLCARFGSLRVNAAIRNRILSNRARRILTSARELGSVGAVPGRPEEETR